MKQYLLKEVIKDRGYRNESLAVALKLNPSTLSRKVRGHSSFTLNEWAKVKEILAIDDELERELLS